MKPEDMSLDELREELERIDLMRRPLSGATMMRRNDVWYWLARRLNEEQEIA